MWKKIMGQAGICVLIALTLMICKKSNVDVLKNGADAVIAQMSVKYTMDDFKTATKKGAETMGNLTGGAIDAVDVLIGKPVYGDPIDDTYEGDRTTVYAVGGGQVTAVGENEEIGKYVKIVHGDQGESLYGNLKSVTVSVPSNVKKGEVIGVYEDLAGKDFYYSFREFQ